VRNAIGGRSSVRPIQDRYIRISDEELLHAADSMTFNHGCMELNFVEEVPQEALTEKGTEAVWKISAEKKKARHAPDLTS